MKIYFEVLCTNISNAYLDLYNSIVENQLESSEMRYGVAKDITKKEKQTN